jgi:hypothetical protein
MYPGPGPSSPEVKPLLPVLVFILSTWWLTRLLELYCLEVEEEVFNLPILRVQAPLYRQGPGYSLATGCPTTVSPVAAVLAWVPPSSSPLPERRPLYKAPFPPDRHIRGICPRFASDPFMGNGLARCGWWRSSVASVTLVSGLCRSCRVLTTFNKASVEGSCCLLRLGPPVVEMPASCWRSRLPGCRGNLETVAMGRLIGGARRW